MENKMADRLVNHARRVQELTKLNKKTMNDLRRQINTIIFDLKLFSQQEIKEYVARMSGATDDELEAILKEAKQLESERWVEYERTRFKVQAA